MKTFTAIATVAFSVLVASPSIAQDQGLKATVSYADLDLSRANGRAVLENRIGRAVETVCPERPQPRELRKRQSFRACTRAAWAGARRQLAAIGWPRPALTSSGPLAEAGRLTLADLPAGRARTHDAPGPHPSTLKVRFGLDRTSACGGAWLPSDKSRAIEAWPARPTARPASRNLDRARVRL